MVKDGDPGANRTGWLWVFALAAAYFVVAALSVRYTRFNGGVALIWGATSLLLPFLVNRPRGQWLAPIVACGVAGSLATILFGLGFKAALPFAVINVGEAVGGALILQRVLPRSGRLESMREIVLFLAVTGIVMPVLCGFPAALTAHLATGLPLGRNWVDYFTGHGLGVITFAPLVMLASSGDLEEWFRKARRRERIEGAVLFVLMVVVNAGVFSRNDLPLLFLPLLPMTIAVFRIGRPGAAVATSLLAVFAIVGTVADHGPISLIQGDNGLRAQFLQFYLACAVLIALPAAAELKQRKRSFANLQQTSAVARLVLDRSGDIIMTMQVDGTIRYVSPSIEAMGGYRPEDLLGRTPHFVIHPEDIDTVVATHRRALATPDDTFIVEYRASRADGTYAWYEGHTRATVDEAGDATGVVSIIHDISARKDTEDRLMRAAQTDPLTGLLNRRAFDAALAQRTASGASFTIVVFDLDHFKAINDTYGHETGDLVLEGFARHLQGTLRKHDVVARLGGEEFVAVLDGADGAMAREVCERLRQGFAVQPQVAVDGRSFTVTLSGGIATFRAGMEAKQLLAEADAALYRAKSAGRNCLELAA